MVFVSFVSIVGAFLQVVIRGHVVLFGSLDGADLLDGITRIVQIARGRFRDLFSREYARTTIQLWLMWFGVACIYYGIILAQSELLTMGGACGGRACI